MEARQTRSKSAASAWAALLLGTVWVAAAPTLAATPEPHVIVAIPDTGINPYHQAFYRPALTAHPCTYIPGFPCDIPALELTLGGTSYAAARSADSAKWASIGPGDWFWIPRTVFVAVHCERIYSGQCIIDDHGHGTGTTSSVLSENPEALIAFKEGGSSIAPFVQRRIPVDIYSVSWGNVAPVPGHPSVLCANYATAPIYVTSAGNDPRSTLIDCRKGHPSLITVGGAYAQDDTEEALATKQPEVVSYYCRPTAVHTSTSATRASYCGTSFSGPTVAGALSKVVLAIRNGSGYAGSVANGWVDPIAGVSVAQLRDAMNRTASYDPAPQYPNTARTGVPLVEQAPWVQWGWGFYDGRVATATLAHLTGSTQPDKPAEAYAYMGAVHAAKDAAYGPIP